MIEITVFFLVLYLILACFYTFEAVINKDKINEHCYAAPIALFWCLLICWFYFPCDIGPKLYKKLNEKET